MSRVKASHCVIGEGKLFLFGGFDEDDKLDGYVYVLDTTSSRWDSRPGHVYREGHSAVYIGDGKVLIYGGCTSDVTERQEEFHGEEMLLYNTVTCTWEAVEQNGTPPKPRSRHAATLSTNGEFMFISGGLKPEKLEPYDDMFAFHIPTSTWGEPSQFIGRFDHSLVHQGDKLWAFGGFNKETARISELTWFDLKTYTTGTTLIHQAQKDDISHIFVQTGNPDFVLDVVVPSWSWERVNPWVGVYDLRNLRHKVVISPNLSYLLNHTWKISFFTNGRLYLVGYALTEETMDATYDYELSHILSINFSELCSKQHSGSWTSDFAKLLFDEKFSDYKIYGLSQNNRLARSDIPFEELESFKSEPIPVHKLILYSRWPHFEMIENSGMAESQVGSLFIPEPVKWVKAFIEYLYTNDVHDRSTDIVTGLLILSNVYRLPELREKALSWLNPIPMELGEVLMVLSRARIAQEEIIAHNAAMICLQNWGELVRTEEFAQLDKEDIISLCQLASPTSSIVDTPESAQKTRERSAELCNRGDHGTVNVDSFPVSFAYRNSVMLNDNWIESGSHYSTATSLESEER
ncbi:uncharacterized protein CYBJADRAFT_161401 [Cyberlindnera jadinii NRRL Y-1542]|uniref:BTB domain-containing protein n=1 Tax=Cyberlindnera jadinii (strain ATCC 18201 / CBS 1600 / BCRC 20928 / JCM 3617 / NBRC 0987 / NRRL Y-1542) TaxID=983966 RepID=A0A1E4S5Y9_CYBJN|nr:hypothetical protein CYBJADRAFT_161401 [Cyberlindnera jadinii NRRL Y-1542]ODV74915.1 hypothetical protein CYBJADRAFT_161401 [Cyberlindnera jadinii NRRL Y-1542]